MRLPGPQELSRLLLSIYEAAAEPDVWPAFLKKFADVCNGASSALLFNDRTNQQYLVAANHNVDPEAQRLYAAHYGALDAYWMGGKHVLRSGWYGTSQSLISDDQMLNSEYYNDFQRHFDMFHMCGAALEYGPQLVSFLTLLRSRRKGAFGNSQVELLKFLTPHLRLAIKTHRKMVDLRAASQNLQTAVDMASSGLVLLGSKSEILSVNRVAASFISRNDGLIGTKGGLRAGTPSESAELERLVAAAVSTAEGKGLVGGGGVLISRRDANPLQVLIVPAPAAKFDLNRSVRAVAFITDPDQRVRPRSEILSSLFRLTSAESRLALLLADGKSLSEIAQALGVSRNTLKTQLTSIYHKTGTSRQAQLVRLLLSLPSGTA
jgi:DNA-binding CsgD family transcriptional regulator